MRHIELDIDNQTLVEECRSGDRDAMSILYTRFAPRMLHVINRYVSDRDSAHDILHDGFIAAFTRIDSLRDPEHIEFWLATIMKNLSLKYLQAQTVTSILEEIPEIVEEPEIDDILDFSTLETLIRQLPEGYQKVFRLAVLEGKSHKEISEILGIAPNSSSSQLFHAKLRMRELIKDYKLRVSLISLLLLLASSGILFLSRQTDDLNTLEILLSDTTPKNRIPESDRRLEPEMEVRMGKSTAQAASSQRQYTRTSSVAAINPYSNSEDSQSHESQTISESTCSAESDSAEESSTPKKKENYSMKHPENDYGNGNDRLFADLQRKKASEKEWSAGISFDPGMVSFNGIFKSDMSSWDHTLNDPDTNNPGPSHGSEEKGPTAWAGMPRVAEDMESFLGSAPRRHHLPISFAITAEKHFSSWLGLESGIAYSYLHTDFERYKEPSTCHWHYLEIPLKVNLYVYTSPHFKVYGSFGGRVSIPVYSYAQIAPNLPIHSGRFNSKTVWSAGGSIGAAFHLSKRVDLFIEPTLRYHFPQECRLPNIWTDDKPWSISVPIGFRFNW